MKNLMKRLFLTALLAVLCFCNNAFAQKQLIIEHNYSSFSDIYANDFFDITIVPSSSYSVKLITDTSMEDFVQAYVKDDAIVLHLDTKGMPKEVRKAFFDAWNGKPRITAEVQMPFVRKVTLDGDSSICSVDEIVTSGNVEFFLTRTASIPNLSLRSRSFLLSLSNKATAVVTVDASSIEADVDNNSSVELTVVSNRLSVFAGGFANCEIYGTAKQVLLQTEGRSKISFNDNYDGTGSGQSL